MTPIVQYSREEVAERGDDIYERLIRPRLKPEDDGKHVAIDVYSENYEIDEDPLKAADRLLARHPGIQVYYKVVGQEYVWRFGPR